MLEKNGLVKLMEECAELIQVAAKKSACMDTDEHWDGAGSLRQRLEDEMGDVMAAIVVVCENFDLDYDRAATRADSKAALFREWMHEAPQEYCAHKAGCPAGEYPDRIDCTCGLTWGFSMNKKTAFELGSVAYIGEKCVVCGRVFDTFEKLKAAVFVQGAKIACQGCVKVKEN